jgi:hypothetical protein
MRAIRSTVLALPLVGLLIGSSGCLLLLFRDKGDDSSKSGTAASQQEDEEEKKKSSNGSRPHGRDVTPTCLQANAADRHARYM